MAKTLKMQDEEPRIGQYTRWKGKPLLTKAEKLSRQRVLARKWRAKNRDKVRAYFKAYAEAHRATLAAYHAAYFKAHGNKPPTAESKAKTRLHRQRTRAQRRLVERRWRDKNRERYAAICRRSRLKRAEAKRAGDARWRRQNPEKYAGAIARSKAAKPELYAQISVNSSLARRARKKAATIEAVRPCRVYARDGDRCHLCGLLIERADRSLDHLVPIVRGGAHAEWNLAPAHLRCNKQRGTRQILSEETRSEAERYIAARGFAVAS